MENKKNILLIEDDFAIGKWLENRILELETIKSLRWEMSSTDGLNSIYQNIPDIIILDLKLPDGSGIEVLKKIRKDKITSKVFVFSVNSELKKICLRYGADMFFDKSVDSEKLIESLK